MKRNFDEMMGESLEGMEDQVFLQNVRAQQRILPVDPIDAYQNREFLGFNANDVVGYFDKTRPARKPRKLEKFERNVGKCVQTISKLIDSRTDRIHAQIQVKGTSIYSFLSEQRNVLLYLYFINFDESKLPAYLPREKDLIVKINVTVRAIRECYQNPNFYTTGVHPAINNWVRARQNVLKRHEAKFGLNRPFRPTCLIQPRTNCSHLLLWNSVFYSEPKECKHGLEKQEFLFDFFKRSLLSEKQKEKYAFINKIRAMDVGVGWLREPHFSHEWAEYHGRPPSLPFIETEPLVNPTLPLPENRQILSTEMIAQARKNLEDHGFAIIHLGNILKPEDINHVNIDLHDFERHTLLDGNPKFRALSLEKQKFIKSEPPYQFRKRIRMPKIINWCRDVVGDKHLFDTGSTRQPLAASTGQSRVGSMYTSECWMKIQINIARILEDIYGEPVCVIPERIRVCFQKRLKLPKHTDRSLLGFLEEHRPKPIPSQPPPPPPGKKELTINQSIYCSTENSSLLQSGSFLNEKLWGEVGYPLERPFEAL